MTIGFINDLAKLIDRPSNPDVTQTLTLLAGTWRWRCLVTLLNHPWFTRVWVIQEVAVAPEVQFIYGGIRFMMETLVAGLNIFLDPQAAALLGHTTESTKAYTSHVRLDMMAALQRNRQPEAGFENLFALPVLLTNFANSESTDPRDKIFALSG